MIEITDEMVLKGSIVVLCYVFLLVTSGKLVFLIISRTSDKEVLKTIEESTLDTGFVVGKCENILIPTLVILGQFTALGLIFAAKAIVRKEDMVFV